MVIIEVARNARSVRLRGAAPQIPRSEGHDEARLRGDVSNPERCGYRSLVVEDAPWMERLMGEVRNTARNAAQSAKGKIKEASGKATGNRRLESKGKTDQAKASAKKTAEKVKNKFR